MAKQASSGANERNPLTVWLIVALIVLALIAGALAMSRHAEQSDPTLTAAPKIVSTPDHPIVIHAKSPEVYEKEMEQAGVPQGQRKPLTIPNLN